MFDIIADDEQINSQTGFFKRDYKKKDSKKDIKSVNKTGMGQGKVFKASSRNSNYGAKPV
jgi:hypothetical protein